MWRRQLLGLLSLLLLSVLATGCMSVAVYDRLALRPDKVNYEFKYDARLQKKVLSGTYLGKASLSGKDYYHLQFADVLKGEGRSVHLYLECQGLNTNSHGHLTGFLKEGALVETPNARKALLFYHYHPSYDTGAVSSEVSRASFSERDQKEYPCYISGWIWDYQGTFICYPPYDWTQVADWDCRIDVARSERSKVMPFIRPLYALPLAVACVPIDIVGTLFSACQIVVSPRRPEAISYLNFVYSIRHPKNGD